METETGNRSAAHRSGRPSVIGRRFHLGHTVQGVGALPRRHDRSCQVPVRRAIEREEAAIAGWVKEA
ncbi:winged helix-turn-helix domain-containing protein [Actinomadura fibrosa]|uniref:Winged helix-turn-helix domain-containing protein n=1 Tax=Actinomadura fibrosa TaxID=111802 RepID=A0ABW2XI17_9ACTN